MAIDGDTAIVGADNAVVDGVTHRGAAYVFARTDGTWAEVAKLSAAGGQQYERFGYAVALHGDTAFVGNHGADVGATHAQGAVHVFDAADGAWSETQKLVAEGGVASDRFGYSIAFDGTRVLVGADNATVAGRPGQGAAYLFEQVGGTWQQVAHLVADDGAEFDTFGSAVALEGDMALVGARGASPDGDVFRGAVYAFAHAGGMWQPTQVLVAGDGTAGAWFGDALALRGGVLAVGAKRAMVGGAEERGRVYLFDFVDGTWTEALALAGNPGAAGDLFGSALAFHGDDALLVGARGAAIEGNGAQGAAWSIDRAEADVVFVDGFDNAAR